MNPQIQLADLVAWLQPHLPRWTPEDIKRWLCERQHERALCLITTGGALTALGVVREETDGSLHIEMAVGNQELIAQHMLVALERRWPDWRSRRVTALRRGRPWQYRAGYFDRLRRCACARKRGYYGRG